MTAARRRRLQRGIHLTAAVVLGAYVYIPAAPVESVVRFVAFPVVALSGIGMWQWARIRRAVNGKRAREDSNL